MAPLAWLVKGRKQYKHPRPLLLPISPHRKSFGSPINPTNYLPNSLSYPFDGLDLAGTLPCR